MNTEVLIYTQYKNSKFSWNSCIISRYISKDIMSGEEGCRKGCLRWLGLGSIIPTSEHVPVSARQLFWRDLSSDQRQILRDVFVTGHNKEPDMTGEVPSELVEYVINQQP